MARLEQWSLVILGDVSGYEAPERLPRAARGRVYEREGFTDGKGVTTSRIVEMGEDYVITRSGTRYDLGEVDPDYVQFLEDNGTPFDPTNPLKLPRTERKTGYVDVKLN